MKSETIDVSTRRHQRRSWRPAALKRCAGVCRYGADRTVRSAPPTSEEVVPARGVSRIVRFDPGVRVGTSEEERRKVAGFVRDIDAAIVGLGT
jgi:hypothetical protein